MPLVFKRDFGHMADTNESQSRNPSFDHFIKQLRPYISNNFANESFPSFSTFVFFQCRPAISHKAQKIIY